LTDVSLVLKVVDGEQFDGEGEFERKTLNEKLSEKEVAPDDIATKNRSKKHQS
jgi:hypothetical protein